jgi:hypothetical protein
VLLILSADGFTKHASINHHVFWVDAFYVLAIFGIFTSMIASLFVSLQDPRAVYRSGADTSENYRCFFLEEPVDVRKG